MNRKIDISLILASIAFCVIGNWVACATRGDNDALTYLWATGLAMAAWAILPAMWTYRALLTKLTFVGFCLFTPPIGWILYFVVLIAKKVGIVEAGYLVF